MAVSGENLALVLVHGGGHDARCWAPTVDAIAARSAIGVLAVDLPGRGTRPGPLRGLHIGDYVDAVAEQITESGLEHVVLVGHSMVGLVLPGVAARLRPGQIQQMVLIAANVVPPGRCALDPLPLPSRLIGQVAARWQRPYRLPKWVARALFCNGMSAEQAQFVIDRLVPEAGWLARERIDGPDGCEPPPTTWILTKRDRAVVPRVQRATIATLNGIVRVVEVDAPHDVMVSHPEALADALLAVCR